MAAQERSSASSRRAFLRTVGLTGGAGAMFATMGPSASRRPRRPPSVNSLTGHRSRAISRSPGEVPQRS
ncbi:twin-arginine translocation signal domain-containing protein [Streptomyces sp. NPDC048674]|uniref:twin-arginine translocation signal domain-containing protein n=1 Tax=Streptomyces sp. NPDC048674 TaxID=3155491 RepID=UPI0034227704